MIDMNICLHFGFCEADNGLGKVMVSNIKRLHVRNQRRRVERFGLRVNSSACNSKVDLT